MSALRTEIQETHLHKHIQSGIITETKLLMTSQLFELILISVSVMKQQWQYMKSHCGAE